MTWHEETTYWINLTGYYCICEYWFQEDKTKTFRTIDYPELCPLSVTTIPTNGAINVSIEINIIINFNTPMNITSVENNLTTNFSYSVSWDINYTEIIITPDSNLEYNITYYIIVGLNSTDSDGCLLGENYILQFTTELEPEQLTIGEILYIITMSVITIGVFVLLINTLLSYVKKSLIGGM
jgi:hypothetical protein